MFDRYVTEVGRTEYVPYEKKVTIKRAPTDESIKLYEEIKEKAYNSILGTLEATSNTLNVCGIVYLDHLSFKKIVKYHVILNGETIIGEIQLEHTDFEDKALELYGKIVTAVSRVIAERVFKIVSPELIRYRRKSV